VGTRNFLIEGVSGTGKSAVCAELRRRGFHALNGDTELAYRGDPCTGARVREGGHEHHLWDVDEVRAIAADTSMPSTYFCGGSRNFAAFLDVFDRVFVLEVDLDTLVRRLDQRPADEWGHTPQERALVLRLHRTREDVPPFGTTIDATQPLRRVVDEILRLSELSAR
jgi:hypothetical protein